MAVPPLHQGRRRRAPTRREIDATPRLDLAGTAVSDAGLEHLRGLTQLRSLNLAGTSVSDTGMEKLKGLTRLH